MSVLFFQYLILHPPRIFDISFNPFHPSNQVLRELLLHDVVIYTLSYSASLPVLTKIQLGSCKPLWVECIGLFLAFNDIKRRCSSSTRSTSFGRSFLLHLPPSTLAPNSSSCRYSTTTTTTPTSLANVLFFNDKPRSLSSTHCLLTSRLRAIMPMTFRTSSRNEARASG